MKTDNRGYVDFLRDISIAFAKFADAIEGCDHVDAVDSKKSLNPKYLVETKPVVFDSPPPIPDETFPAYIARLRRMRGWNKKQASEILGLGEGTLARLESGKNPALSDTLDKLSRGYGVEIKILTERMRLYSPTPTEDEVGK